LAALDDDTVDWLKRTSYDKIGPCEEELNIRGNVRKTEKK